MATSGELRQEVAAFMHREPKDFVVGKTDTLLRAMNNARLFAERTVDFEYARVDVEVPNVSLTAGADLSTAVLAGTVTSIPVKKIKKAFLGYTNANGTFPIEHITKDAWNARLQRQQRMTLPNESPQTLSTGPLTLVQSGTKIFISPATETLGQTFTVYLDAIRWLPPYTTNGLESDFILNTSFDWLMYRTIQELNFFLKEDDRVVLSAALVSAAWESLIGWNTNYIEQSAADANLD
jgi:hypothetical protein